MDTFVVGKLDNLYTIAKAFSEKHEGLTFPMVAAFNGKDLATADLIYPGDRFDIPELYKIKGGDSLGKIAKSLGVSSKELVDANKVLKPELETRPGDIKAGAYLIIPRNAKGHYMDAVLTGERKEADTAKEEFGKATKIATDKREGYEAKVGELEEKNRIVKADWEATKGELFTEERELDAAASAEARARAERDGAQAVRESALSRRGDAQAELSGAETERSVAGSKVEIAQGALDEASDIRTRAEAEEAAEAADLDAAKKELRDAEALKGEVEAARADVSEILTKVQEKVSVAEENRDTAEHERGIAAKALVAAKDDLAAAKTEREAAKAEQEDCLKKFEVVEAALKDAEKAYKWAQDNRLGRAAKGKAGDLVEYKEYDYNEAGEILEGAEQKLYDAEGKVKAGTVKVGETGKKFGEADQTLAKAKAELANAMEMLTKARENLSIADETLAQAEERVVLADGKVVEAQEDYSKANSKAEEARKLHEQARDGLIQADEKFTEADEKFTKAEKDLKEAADGLETAIAGYEKKLATWKGKDKELAQERLELAAAREKLTEAGKSLDKTRAELIDAYRTLPEVEKAEADSKAAGEHADVEKADVKWAELLAGSSVHKPKTVINKGSLEAREWLQTTLKELGHYEGLIDGDIGKMSVAAIKEFQKSAGLKADGVAGDNTVGAIREALEAKIGDVKLTYHGPIPKNDVENFVANASAPRP